MTGGAHSKDNACKLEVLGHGQQLATFGFHQSGAFLEWDDQRAPGMGLTVDDLTVVNEEQLREFLDKASNILDARPKAVTALSPGMKIAAGDGQNSGGAVEANVADVASALLAIPNNEPPDWEQWKRIAMAVHAATGGSEEGYAAFAAWSAKNSADEPGETRRAWDEITSSPPDRIGAGTLFHLAKQADPQWRSPSNRSRKRSQSTSHGQVTYPENFRLTDRGLFHLPAPKGDEEAQQVWIAAPFEIVGQCCDVDSQGWGLMGLNGQVHRPVSSSRDR